jgi:hypothetical protein
MTYSKLKHGYRHNAAFDKGHLRVDPIHEIYYEQYGKEDGLAGMATPGMIRLEDLIEVLPGPFSSTHASSVYRVLI